MKIDYEKAWNDLKPWLQSCERNEFNSLPYTFTMERMEKIIKKQTTAKGEKEK